MHLDIYIYTRKGPCISMDAQSEVSQSCWVSLPATSALDVLINMCSASRPCSMRGTHANLMLQGIAQKNKQRQQNNIRWCMDGPQGIFAWIRRVWKGRWWLSRMSSGSKIWQPHYEGSYFVFATSNELEPHVRRALTHSEGLDALAPLDAPAPHGLTGVIGTPSKSPPSLNEFIQDIARPIYIYIVFT